MENSIASQRSFAKFYLVLFGFCLFYFLMGFAVLGIFIHDYHSDHFKSKEYGLLILFVGIVITIVYIVYNLFKSVPSIKLNKEFIQFNSTQYYWDDLEELKLTGKLRFLVFYFKEGVSLKFKGQKEKRFFDLYANTPAIKRFIQYRIIEKQTLPISLTEKPTLDDIKHESFVNYKGIYILNYRVIIQWIIIAGIVYGIIDKIDQSGFLLPFIGLGLVVVWCFSWNLYYFEISNKFILVRNHNLFWVKHIYRLSDIQEIVLESQDKMPNCLRVITKDFESRLYRAATLSDNNWRGLKIYLEGKDIKIRINGIGVSFE